MGSTMRGPNPNKLACIVLALVIAGAGAARADQKPINLDLSSLDDKAISDRVDYLSRRLDDERRGAQFWQFGWTAFNGGSMIATAVLASQEDDHKDRVTDIVESAQSLIGVAALLLRPLPAQFGADPIRSMPDRTREDKLARLETAEDLVRRGAERAEEPGQWLPQLGLFGINLGAAVAIWQFADFRHAYQSAIPSVIIGEIQLWTTPSRPADDWHGYRTEFAPGHALEWRLSPRQNGIGVAVNF